MVRKCLNYRPSPAPMRVRGRRVKLALPLRLAPADVAAAEQGGGLDCVDCGVSTLLRLADAVAAGGDVEDAAAVGDELAVRGCGAGVEDLGASRFRLAEIDRAALGGGAGVAVGGHHYC